MVGENIVRVIYIDYKILTDMLSSMQVEDISSILRGRRVIAMDDSTYKFFEEHNTKK